MSVRKIIFVLVLTTLFLGISACRQEDTTGTNAPLRPVKTLTIALDTFTPKTYYAASINAVEETTLSFKVAGTVVDVLVKAGDRLQTNDLVVRLDDQDYKLQVQQAEANHVKAQAEARNARARYERTRGLYEVDSASRSDLDAARAGFEASKAAVKAATKQLDLLQRQLSYTRLLSPRACQVATVWVEKSENVAVGQGVVTLSCGNRFEARTQIPETLVSAIAVGDTVDVNLKALNKKTGAVITALGKISEQQTAAFAVSAELQTAPPELRSGMSAEIGFPMVQNRHGLIVPAIAVSEDAQGRFVYLLEPSADDKTGTVIRRAVSTGALSDQGIVIQSGLKEGEHLIIAGISHIQDGQRVLMFQGDVEQEAEYEEQYEEGQR